MFTTRVAYAHDIWLFPEQFTLGKGDTLIVRQLMTADLSTEALRSGVGQELPFLRHMTPRFELITPDGAIDLLGELPHAKKRPELKPILERKMNSEGLALLTMEHSFVDAEFPTGKFLEFLTHEEFDTEKFQKHVRNSPTQRERYARTFKCLVQIGRIVRGKQHKQILGQELEILLLQNPYLLDPGDDLQIKVIFKKEPLPNVLVKAYNSDGTRSVSKHSVFTNVQGIAEFNLDRSGYWLIRLVHLLSCADRHDDDCAETDWLSYWTSYSFKLD